VNKSLKLRKWSANKRKEILQGKSANAVEKKLCEITDASTRCVSWNAVRWHKTSRNHKARKTQEVQLAIQKMRVGLVKIFKKWADLQTEWKEKATKNQNWTAGKAHHQTSSNSENHHNFSWHQLKNYWWLKTTILLTKYLK
jgi:hypothetical protein